MRVTVVGGGTWGTAFSRLLLDLGHDVTLVCRDGEQARAIAETGHNPRYLPQLDLSGLVPSPGLGTWPERACLGRRLDCRRYRRHGVRRRGMAVRMREAEMAV